MATTITSVPLFTFCQTNLLSEIAQDNSMNYKIKYLLAVLLGLSANGCTGIDYGIHEDCFESSYGDRVYMTCSAPVEYSQAQYFCETMGGELATVPATRAEAIMQGHAVEAAGETMLWSGWPVQDMCPVVDDHGATTEWARWGCTDKLRFLCDTTTTAVNNLDK